MSPTAMHFPELTEPTRPDIEDAVIREARRRARRRRRTYGVMAAVAAVIAATVAASLNRTPPPPGSATAGTSSRADIVGDGRSTGQVLHFYDLATGDWTPADGYSKDATYWFSHDGTRVACSGRCFGKTGQLYVADSDGSDLVELHVPPAPDHTGRLFDAEPSELEWTPDGTKLLYQSSSMGDHINIDDVILHDIASNKTRTLIDFGLHDRSYHGLPGFDISPDGSTVLYSLPRRPFACPEPDPESPCTEHEDFDLWSVPITGGDPTLVLRDAGVPQYLADGQGIAFVEAGTDAWDGGSISIFAHGTRRTLATVPSHIEAMETSPDRSEILLLSSAGVSIVDVATGDTSQLSRIRGDDVGSGNTTLWSGGNLLLMGAAFTRPEH